MTTWCSTPPLTHGATGNVSNMVKNANRQALFLIFQFSMRISRELRLFLCIFVPNVSGSSFTFLSHRFFYFISHTRL